MDWDQIESKWAAMTRRVRGDLSLSKAESNAISGRRIAKSEIKVVGVADIPASVPADPSITMSAQ